MNILSNIDEGLRSVRANLLRTVLTACIIAIGITSLVGILTAIDSMKNSITSSLTDLGANSFDVSQKDSGKRQRHQGKQEKVYPPLSLDEVQAFEKNYGYPASIAVSTDVSWQAEVKHGSEKTDPNVGVLGVNENFVANKGYVVANGRGFSSIEQQYGSNVVLLGNAISENLFPTTDPVQSTVSFFGSRYLVVGVLEKQGSSMGGRGADRSVLIPLLNSSKYGGSRELEYEISALVDESADLDLAMGEATGVMRLVRRDQLGAPDSFEVTKSESMAAKLDDISGYLRMGGFTIGFITLLGASIGLMNIMLVSVTERTREIGVRKALGATPAKIRQQFLIEAIVICQLGGIAGVVLGITIGNSVAALIGEGGFIIPWLWMGVGLTICVIVGLLSGWYPAFKASKLDPIEALRFE